MITPNRPRAAHKLNLQDGDRVKLVRWQDHHQGVSIGKTYQRRGDRLETINNPCDYWNFPPTFPKGYRPLFVVVSRATPPVPDKVLIFNGQMVNGEMIYTRRFISSDTYRLTLTFNAGSNTGTVVREEL